MYRKVSFMDLLERNIKAQNRHPWEMSRSKCLLDVFDTLHQNFPDTTNIKIADIGAGDRYFDLLLKEQLEKYNVHSEIICIDANYKNNEIPEKGILLGTDISQIEDNSMDFCFLMDVMEHVEDDKEFLLDVTKKLKHGGFLIITVPAFQRLFSIHDKFLKHYRRYDISMLNNIIPTDSMRMISWNYFYTLLSIIRYVQIRFNLLSMDKETGIAQWKYDESHLLTKFIKFCLNVDFKINMSLSKYGIHLPGLSLLTLMQKNKNLSENRI